MCFDISDCGQGGDCSSSQVLRIGLARAVILGRHFDKFHDRCVQSSFEDYAESLEQKFSMRAVQGQRLDVGARVDGCMCSGIRVGSAANIVENGTCGYPATTFSAQAVQARC